MPDNFMIVVLPLVAIVFDFIVGFVAAMKNGMVSSTVMRRGMWNKLSEVLAIMFGFLCEFGIEVFGASTLGFSVNIPIVTGICVYIFLYEVVSIIENLGRMNPALAEKLTTVIGIHPDKMRMNGGE
jgi:phage-related holin